MIKVVLFDFYGVFMPDTYGAWLEANGLRREGIFVKLINDLDQSAITKADFFAELSKAVGRKVARTEIGGSNAEPDTKIVEVVRELKPRYDIGLFSNASKELRTKLETLKLTPLFDTIIISSEIGHAKPSDEAFEIAIQKLGAEPSQILFIDDNPHNIEAARRHALQVLHHTATDNTIAELRSRGVL